MHYAYAFDANFALFLRERKYVSLNDMMNDAIEVEVNLMAFGKIKHKTEVRRIKKESQAFISWSSSNSKFDMMIKVMDKLSIYERHPTRDHNEPNIRNPNFRRPQGPPSPQILQIGQRNQNDQVRPHFQEKLIDETFTEHLEDHIHQLGGNEVNAFVTKEEHDRFQFENNEFQCSQRSNEYPLGYQNAVMDFQKQLNLRNKNVMVNLPKKNLANQSSTS